MKNNIRLTESQLKKIITESVKKVLKEDRLPKLPGYDKWKTSTPASWESQDIISYEDFIDMVLTEDARNIKEFVEWLKDYDEEIYEAVAANAGGNENAILAAMKAGLNWEEIAREFYDMKPVRYYPGDLDENKAIKKTKVRLTESRLKKMISESVKRVIKEQRRLLKEGAAHLYDYIDGYALIENLADELYPDMDYAEAVEKVCASDPAIAKICDREYCISADGYSSEPTYWDDGGSSIDVTDDDGLTEDIKQIKNPQIRQFLDKLSEEWIGKLEFRGCYEDDRQDYADAEMAEKDFDW